MLRKLGLLIVKNMKSRNCTKCGIEKNLDQFHNATKGKYGKRSMCKSCDLLAGQKWLRENRKKALATSQKWRENNTERYKAAAKKIKQKHAERYRGVHLTKYWPGVSWEEALALYEKLLESQNRCCAICKKHESHFKRKLHTDHNHKTGKVRGALCFRCNRLYVGIHTLETAQKIVEYLKATDG